MCLRGLPLKVGVGRHSPAWAFRHRAKIRSLDQQTPYLAAYIPYPLIPVAAMLAMKDRCRKR